MDRATGPYAFAYWTMFLSATLLPFTLFYKKLAANPWYALFVAVCMKIGWYFERFVIFLTSYQRDYLPNQMGTNWLHFPLVELLLLFLQGFVLAIVFLGIFELIEHIKRMGKGSLQN